MQPTKQQLIGFVQDLAVTVQRCGIYPGGHPTVDASIASLCRAADEVLQTRASLSLGVARRQLIVEGQATEGAHPLLRALAERLHRHRLGAIVFRHGLEEAELKAVVRALADDPDRSGSLGLATPERLAEWPHIGLFRVSYDQLHLAGPDGDRDELGGTAAELWLGLARLAMSHKADGVPERSTAEELAAALNQRAPADAEDRMIVSYLLQLGEELKREGVGAAAVRARVSRLIRALDKPTLERLLSMGADRRQRHHFFMEAAATLRSDAVLDIVQAASRTDGQDVSTSLMRMLTKLATAADHPAEAIGEQAEVQLRQQVQGLLRHWSLDDPNPEAYTDVLEALAHRETAQGDDLADIAPEPLRMIEMAIELDTVGRGFDNALDSLIQARRHADLYPLLDPADTANVAIAAVWKHLAQPGSIRVFTDTEPVDFDALDPLLDRLPAAVIVPALLERLIQSESRATRLGMYTRIARLGSAAVPFIVERLSDGRWFVLRNMLALLEEIGTWPPGFSALGFAAHEHEQVRRQAVALAVRIPAEREQAIAAALLERDERTLRAGIGAAHETGLPSRAIAPALQRITDESLSGEARASLIRLLRGQPAHLFVKRLLPIVATRRLWFLRFRLAPRSPQMLAALELLASADTADKRIRAVLRMAASSRDPEVRAAVEGRRAGAR